MGLSSVASVLERCGTTTKTVKDLWILRHGQATHNPRAEAAKAVGCSLEEFLEWMRKDDSLDSPLTDLGLEQATSVNERHGRPWGNSRSAVFDLVVSSPLSRAIQTADAAIPSRQQAPNRVCYESFREINGWLLNAKRRPRKELQSQFPYWNFDLLFTEEDTLWTETLESNESCRQRGYDGLCWLLRDRHEAKMLLVAHGGILRQTMAELPELVKVDDGRSDQSRAVKPRSATARFDNAELRRYQLQWDEDAETATASERPRIRLTEIDLDDKWTASPMAQLDATARDKSPP